MALEPGTTLGPYQIVAPIGAGGMGEVYKAKDTRLDRTVAIKVLPEHLAESPERKERFEREARAISQLNHPHICTLFDVGEQNGVLANREEAQTHRLLWYDRQGGSTPALPRPGVYINPVVSPDGERLAFESGSTRDRGRSIWVVDRRGVMSRFTFSGPARRPQWSPDGRSIFFSRGGAIYPKDAAGGSDEDVVFSAENMRVTETSISPDGLHALADVDAGSGRGGDIWVVPLVEDAEPVAFLDSPFMELDGRFSPDGRFVAYSSWQSGRGEVYVRPYPPASGQWQVSTNGGSEPRWSDDGRELYYLTREQELVVVPLSTTPTFEPGVPQTLFELRVGSRTRHNYDVVGSQRFLVSVQDGEDLVPTTITLDWPALLDR